MGLGQYQTGLAKLTPELARGDIGTLTGVGEIQQRQAQREKDAAAEAAKMAAMEPYQRLGTYGAGIQGLAPFMGGTSTAITPDPTALQTALGWTSVLGGIMNPNIGTQYVNWPGQTTSNQGATTSSFLVDPLRDIAMGTGKYGF